MAPRRSRKSRGARNSATNTLRTWYNEGSCHRNVRPSIHPLQPLRKRLLSKDRITEPLKTLLSTGAVLANRGATIIFRDRRLPTSNTNNNRPWRWSFQLTSAPFSPGGPASPGAPRGPYKKKQLTILYPLLSLYYYFRSILYNKHFYSKIYITKRALYAEKTLNASLLKYLSGLSQESSVLAIFS